jgi:cytoskeleton protein RodZ
VPLPALKTSIYGTQTPQRTNSYLPFAILAAGAAVFLIAIASFFAYKPKPVTQTPASPSSPASTVSGAAPSPVPSPTATSGAMPVQVSMNLTEEAWVQITSDGKVVFEGVQPKNFQKVWSAKKSLTIVSGNAGAVLLSSNQSPPKPMGKAGAVQEVSFPAAAPVP